MDFLKKAKDFGKRASDETARAVSATVAAGTKLKDGIADKMGSDLADGGFGTVAKKALDKSTEVMLSSSVSLFNSVVRRLAEEPKYYLITNEHQLIRLRLQVESKGRDWNTYSDSELIRLRAIFSNSWKTIDVGLAINAHLAARLSERINEVVRLLKEGDEGLMISDPQVLAVIDAMQTEGKQCDQYNDTELNNLITSIINAEQHYYDYLYAGLKFAQNKEWEKSEAILARVEATPHFLVHIQLANIRRDSISKSYLHNIEIARLCRPGDLNLYESSFSGDKGHEVLAECRSLFGVNKDR